MLRLRVHFVVITAKLVHVGVMRFVNVQNVAKSSLISMPRRKLAKKIHTDVYTWLMSR